MCGIVGITSTKKVSVTILNSLRKLEYRGYDSAGIATLESGIIKEVKCEGRVDALEHNLAKQKLEGNIGIEKQGGMPVAVTTISPTYESTTVPVKADQNGDFVTRLNLAETGIHEIIVSYNGKTIDKISHQVTDESALEYAETDVLSLRLSILQTLGQILEVLFGK